MIKLFLIVLLTMLLLYSLFYLGTAFIYFFSMKKQSPKTKDHTKFSVIIPARNEEKNITNILNDLIQQDYPKELYEIIVVDDESTDQTNDAVQKFLINNPGFDIKLLHAKNNVHKKKGALSIGIKSASNEMIITRDADTISNTDWLLSISSFIQMNEADMYIGPVQLRSENTVIGVFQEMEHVVLQSSGGGMAILNKPYLCNGANLVFKKSMFEALKGYEGNLNEPSGDDIFLMEKFRKNQKIRIQFIPFEDASVTTFPISNFRDLLQQKLRWSGKFRWTTNPINTFSASLFVLTHLLLTVSPLIIFESSGYTLFVILIVLIKITTDYLLLLLSNKKMNLKSVLIMPIFSVCIPMYLLCIFLCKPLLTNSWKGR